MCYINSEEMYAPINAANDCICILKVLSKNVLYYSHIFAYITLKQFEKCKSNLIHNYPPFTQEDVPYADNHIVRERASIDAHKPLRTIHCGSNIQLCKIGI